MDVIQNDASDEEPLCCRACLSTDGRLFNIHEYKLGDAFACIIGTPVQNDKLPQHLCAYCGAQLLKSASFRDMCLRSQRALTSELLKEKLNSDGIRRINRPCNQFLELTLTEVHTIECIDLPIDIKPEPKIQTVDIIYDSSNRARTSEAKVKLEMDIDSVYTDEVKTESDVESEMNVSTIKLVKVPLKKKPVKKAVKKVKPVKPERKAKKRGRKKQLKVMRRSAENNYNPEFDVTKFEGTYGVKVMILSKEEQLADVAARKESENYLESRFQCDHCGKGFAAEAAYHNHMLRHDPSKGDFVCEICTVRYKQRYQVQKHQDFHRLKLVCEACGFVSRSRCQAKVHHLIHEGKTYECQYCGKTIQKKSTYFSHMRVVHPALLSACDECGETFVGDNGLRMHKLRAHAATPQKYKCSTCSAKFISVEALKRHKELGQHSGLPCEQCGDNCASEEELREHVELKHPKETHRCEDCDMNFASSNALEVHYRRKHLNERPPFMAREDLVAYNRRKAARHRTRMRAGPEADTKPFMCETCGQVLRNSTLLRYHQRLHDEGNPFKCNHCSKTFALKCNLQTHMRTHTGERPFQCADCPLAFSEKRNLLRHHRTAHQGIRERIPCTICGRELSTKSAVKLHVATVHDGQPWPRRDRKRPKHDKPVQ